MSDLKADPELARELMQTDPPCDSEQRTTMLEEDDPPFSRPEPEPLPTQPDLDPPPRAVAETYIDDLATDSDDFRDTIPAPVPPPEEI